MIAFCGYNVLDYFDHWLRLGPTLKDAPRIYLVNWFRKDANGKFIWPGYGENMRVLKWVIERVEGKAGAKSTPLGNVPETLDMKGLDNFGAERLAAATAVSKNEWREEMTLHAELIESRLAGSRVPHEILHRYEELKSEFFA
jgi:phosphoenolpyruvate carboxykinase (GTP)